MGIDHAFHDFDNRTYALQAVKKLQALGRKRLALLAPPSNLSYAHHMRDGFAEGLAECGLGEVPLPSITVDHSIDEIRARVRDLMQRPNRPDGIVSGSGQATFAVVAAIEDCGLTVGKDVDIVSKQSARLLHLLRPVLYVVTKGARSREGTGPGRVGASLDDQSRSCRASGSRRWSRRAETHDCPGRHAWQVEQ